MFSLRWSHQAELEKEAQERAQSWQNFKKGKGAKKQARRSGGPVARLGSSSSVTVTQSLTSPPCPLQAGFFSSLKKESMFKVPEELGGKVGVIGSGKGVRKHSCRLAQHELL